MRHKNIRKFHQQFMYSMVAMAIVVMLVAAVFWYWCLPVK